MLVSLLLLGLIIFSGHLAKLPRAARFSMAKAFALVAVETLLGSLSFSLFWAFLTLTNAFKVLLEDTSSFFILVLVIAVIDGLLLYWIKRYLSRKIPFSLQVLTLAEYVIQWSLIYITVYQVLFDSLFSKDTVNAISQLNVSTPTDLMVLVLPSLISVWIGIILYKVHQKDI